MQALRVRVSFYTLLVSLWLGCGRGESEDPLPDTGAEKGAVSFLVGLALSQAEIQQDVVAVQGGEWVEWQPIENTGISEAEAQWWDAKKKPSGDLSLGKLIGASRTSCRTLVRKWKNAGHLHFIEANDTYLLFHSPLPVNWAELELAYGQHPAWWSRHVRLPEALSWLKTQSVSPLSPVIAIFDSGVDIEHHAFAEGRIWNNPAPGTFGCDKDIHGCNTGASSSKGELGTGAVFPHLTGGYGQACPMDTVHGPSGDCFHGTHVAGVIAGDVRMGAPGICPMCRILPIKVMVPSSERAQVTDESFLKALIYVYRINERFPGLIPVINASFGKKERSRIVEFYIRRLYEQGTLLVAAAGNDDTEARMFPAALPEVIAVTALGRNGEKAPYANFGTWVDVAAPGGDDENAQGLILSLVPGSGVALSQGTSVAAPFVTGVLGFHAALYPGWSGEARKRALLGSLRTALYDPQAEEGVNAAYYQVQVDGQSVGLLGKGSLDVLAFLQPSPSKESFAQLEPPVRVPVGCGVIAGGTSGEEDFTGIRVWALLFLPLLWVAYLSRKRDPDKVYYRTKRRCYGR